MSEFSRNQDTQVEQPASDGADTQNNTNNPEASPSPVEPTADINKTVDHTIEQTDTANVLTTCDTLGTKLDGDREMFQAASVTAAAEDDEQMLTDKSDDNIANLTLDQKKELISAHNFIDQLHVGTFLDAVDTTHDFLLAQVVSINATQVTVHFDGWSDRWNAVSRHEFPPFINFRLCRLTA